MLIQLPKDQRGLDQNCSRNRQNVGTILFPCRRITEKDFASWRQTAFADAPALHLPPIKHWARKLNWGYLNFAWLFSAEDADGNGSGLLAAIGYQEKWAAYDRAAEERFVIRKNRRVSDSVKSC